MPPKYRNPLAAENAALKAENARLKVLCAINPEALAEVLGQIADHSPPESIAGHLRKVADALRSDGMVLMNGPPQRQKLPAAFTKPSGGSE